MSNTTELLELKQTVEEMKQDKHKAEGALEQIMGQIRTEFQCKDLESAEKLLQKIQKENKRTKESLIKETEKLEQELEEHETDQ